MDQFLSLFNVIIGASTIVLQIGLIIVIFILLFSPKHHHHPIIILLNRHVLILSFLTAFFGLILSLFYSNIVGYAPCELCWFQRIFLYSEAFILGLALWKKDKHVIDYSLLLSIIGIIISIYHKYVEISGTSLVCGAGNVSCAKIYVLEFGYITIPVMAMTSFATIIILMIIRKLSLKNEL